jgi:Domain of unknown function (DUF4375)
VASIVSLLVGCTRSTDRPVQFPFDHPAAKEANRLFRTLEVNLEDDYKKLPKRDRYVWDVSWFEAEVMNGGVDQYFYNSAGDHAAECLKALQAIGAKQSYSLLKKACDLFPQGQPSANRTVRQQQLRDLTGKKHIDDLISGEIEVDLYQQLLDYYHDADPKGT